MIEKFNRNIIACINSIKAFDSASNKKTVDTQFIAVPEKETFKYVFDNAKKGNEMAAVLLEEWQASCKPKDKKEEQVIKHINMAASKIFK